MRRSVAALLAFAGTLPAAEPEVRIGTKVDDLRFKDIRYLSRSLADFGEKKAYVLAFVQCGCPLAEKYLPVLSRLDGEYRDRGVQFAAVNSGPAETVTVMAAQAVEFGVEFPFLKDADCKVADALGMTRTPEVVVLDAARTIRYRGRIDDQYRAGGQRAEPTRRDLVEALDAVLAGKPVTVATTPLDGCLLPRPVEAGREPVTFADHVAPILRKHCQACHQPETVAPFSLVTYEHAKAKGRTVAEVVNEGRMPPWYAAPRTADRVQHKSLSATERETIVRWVKSGMARGDDSKLPKPPDPRPVSWQIGDPDLVLKAPPFQLPTEGDIPYKYVVLPHVFDKDTWVRGVQILPDVPRAVHHANLAYWKVGESFKESNFVTGVVPGGEPMTVGDRVAFLIPKGSVLGIQIHYVPTGKAENVSLRVGLKFADGTVDKQLRHLLFVTTRYTIPPGAAAHPVAVERTLDRDIVGIGMFSHMHVRGKAMSFTARTPDGNADKLLTISNYNFEWQIPYRWAASGKVLPKGTKIECVALYDNSPFNPYNPDSTKAVKDGQQTYQEMMNGFLFYVNANEKLGLDIDPKTGTVRPAGRDSKPGR